MEEHRRRARRAPLENVQQTDAQAPAADEDVRREQGLHAPEQPQPVTIPVPDEQTPVHRRRRTAAVPEHAPHEAQAPAQAPQESQTQPAAPVRKTAKPSAAPKRAAGTGGRKPKIKSGSSALKSVKRSAGGAALFVLMLLGEAGRHIAGLFSGRGGEEEKKVRKLSLKRPQRKRLEKPQIQTTEQNAGFELEAIRPEQYRGRSHTHVEKQRNAQAARRAIRARLKAIPVNTLISAVLVCVALFSLWQIGSIVVRSVRTHSLNSDLAQRRAQLSGQTPEEGGQPVELLLTETEEFPQAVQTPAPEQTPDAAQETERPLEETAPQTTEEPQPTAAPDTVRSMKYHHMGGDALPEMAAMYEENRDLIAWLDIPDVLDLPVVYRDNSYYLTRDFYKQKNVSGTIFLDVNHPFKEKTQNLLLHGHNMKDGTMFGRLAQYLYDNTYLKNHPFISFSTLWRKEQYVIFAVLNVSLDVRNERFFNYFTHDTFNSDAEFNAYIRQLQLRSYYAIPVDVAPTDALLTLSTCLEDDRLVIVARRLREGETRAELRQRIHTATRQ